MSYFKGVPYIILWFASILAGYAGFFCPLLPLMFISNKWYRRITDFYITFWQMYPAALLEFVHGCEIRVTGDAIDSSESILLVMNHRTRTDWSYLWPAVSRATFGRNRWMYPTKFVLKDPIRHVPGVGWMMQLGSYLYIKRHWQEDQIKMARAIEFFAELKSPFSLLIFPEGTDLTPQTKANSDRYADKMGLPTSIVEAENFENMKLKLPVIKPMLVVQRNNKLGNHGNRIITTHVVMHYNNVLHPRTTGFCFLAEQMLQRNTLDAIYDVTIAYVDRVPQNEKSLINGILPKRICIHFQRHVPRQDFDTTEKALHTFLEARWAEKEHTLEQFQAGNRHTQFDSKNEIKLPSNRRNLIAAFIFWTLLPIPVVYMLSTSSTFRYIVLAHTGLLLLVNFFSDGFQSLEIGVYRTKKGIKRMLIHHGN